MPEHGSVTVKGKLVPFIELGVGFNPELTGRENVYLNGALLGFTRAEIDAMYDDIVEFAELEDFMDQKLKNYSSGMQVRLAFSVAIKAQGDILVLDEVLAVGDEAAPSSRRCSKAMSEVSMTDNNTVDERPVVLKVDHVAKSFRLPTEQATGLKMAFLNWTKGIKGYTEQHVLRDINFEVHQGDFFGIVGRNGSGKSTLLKIISQIYVPEQGSVMVKGKLVPFIELGVGFNPELTGRENVYLNGALLGFTHEEIDAMYDDIVEFAELEDFMDQKLKNYSSGMQVRLAFSVAIKAQGDILVLDEVLAVGDEAFQRKCDNFFAEDQERSDQDRHPGHAFHGCSEALLQ